MSKQTDFLFDIELSKLDRDVALFHQYEQERQDNNLLMIPSESLCPRPVREALTTVFGHKYAEGYPSYRMSRDERNRVTNEVERYLAFHRRYGDRRFYKGAEYSNFIEVVAQGRAAQIFANPNAKADEIFVNVQPLSGAAANNAVYNAFLVPGDTIMGMSLSSGGHLTHGSPFNRSGRQYKVVSYSADVETGKLDYDHIAQLTQQHAPKIIIAGASAYPLKIDWKRLKEIALNVPVQIEGLSRSGAILMADIAHPAGLVIAGLFPNPVGTADVTSLTTHKTLCGPRGAIIMSTEEDIAKKIDLGVFPGEQGGPHLNNIAAKAVAFKIASTPQFKLLQQKIVENCRVLADEFKRLGLKLAYGGTESHMVLINLDGLTDEIPLRGDVASNILDLCGITCNKNALPGDETGARPRGIRFGTTILSQRGMGPKEMKTIAGLVHKVLTSIKTFSVISPSGETVRGKIDGDILAEVRQAVDKLTSAKSDKKKFNCIEVAGERATAFLQSLVPGNLYQLKPNQTVKTHLAELKDEITLAVKELDTDHQSYIINASSKMADKVLEYLTGLSDGYVTFDNDDIYAKIEGPVVIRKIRNPKPEIRNKPQTLNAQNTKPYFIGQKFSVGKTDKQSFKMTPYSGEPRKTALYEEHLKLTRPQFIVPFAGWSMPLWYTRASEEHQTVRQNVGLFDVSHMGKLQFTGPYASRFLDLVTTNYVPKLKIGQSHYSYILGPDGHPLDDILLYKMAQDDYLMVVNAANMEKIKQWLDAVNSRQVIIDKDNPSAEVEGSVNIRNRGVDEPLINVALQGPNGLKLLLKLSNDVKALRQLKKSHFIWTELGGMRTLVARTGYTGEDIAFEIFTSKQDCQRFWNLLLEAGKGSGIKPCGLAARDSLRAEAGLPLYGHELNGEHLIMPTEAGYGAFIKRHKPYFIGRKPYLKLEKASNRQVVRFKITTPGARAIKSGDAVLSDGNKIGLVTSCVLVPGGVQVGLALVEKKYAGENTTLNIQPAPRKDETPPLMDALVLPRFLRK